MTLPPLWTFPYALGLPGAVALALGRKSLAWASLILFANWAVLTFLADLTRDQFNVALNMTVDVISCYAVAWLVRGKSLRAAVVFSFGFAMLFHADAIIKLLQGMPDRTWHRQYYWRFSYLAWAQAALLIGWAVHGTGMAVGKGVVALDRARRRPGDVGGGSVLVCDAGDQS